MTRTRRTSSASLSESAALSAFKWTTAGGGVTGHLLDGPTFPDAAAARAGWECYRRSVWKSAHRMTVPPSAMLYDELTTAGHALIWSTWKVTAGLDFAAVRAALASDEAAVVAFERANPAAAAQIADYLAAWRADSRGWTTLPSGCRVSPLAARLENWAARRCMAMPRASSGRRRIKWAFVIGNIKKR